LEDLADRLQKSGRHLLVCGMRDQPARLLAQAEFHDKIGENNIQPTLAGACARAREILGINEPTPVPRVA
jgi:SulP family sulfate permease